MIHTREARATAVPFNERVNELVVLLVTETVARRAITIQHDLLDRGQRIDLTRCQRILRIHRATVEFAGEVKCVVAASDLPCATLAHNERQLLHKV